MALYTYLRPMASREREAAIGKLQELVQAEATSESMDRTLTESEVVELSKHSQVEIGAHTVTHPVLPILPVEEQELEVRRSKDKLAELTGRSIQSFSYPNGEMTFSTREIVRQTGFRYACTSTADVTLGGCDPLSLPRFWIPDWDGDTFSVWLQRWV